LRLWTFFPSDIVPSSIAAENLAGHSLNRQIKRRYRLVNKYMPQPGLMKMRRTFINKICLSSDAVSISFTYFLNSLYPSLKYPIQFLLIDTLQNRLSGFKKLVFISDLGPFEFLFHCQKQVEVTGARSGESGGCGMRRIPCGSNQSVEARLG
jgi:hypothetical protein